MNPTSLYCLPFAGGNSYSYRPLQEKLRETPIQMMPLELPGRGKRIREPLLNDLNLLAMDALKQLIQHDLTQRYALFGHSMGALLVYLVAQQLVARRLPLPVHIFVSGHRAPNIEPRLNLKHNLPKTEFIAMLQRLGGCPPEILQDAELLNFFEPMLRADFQAVDLYKYQPRFPLPIPFTVLLGSAEAEVTLSSVQGWQQETSYPLIIKEFQGGHFFVSEQPSKVAETVAQTLEVGQ